VPTNPLTHQGHYGNTKEATRTARDFDRVQIRSAFPRRINPKTAEPSAAAEPNPNAAQKKLTSEPAASFQIGGDRPGNDSPPTNTRPARPAQTRSGFMALERELQQDVRVLRAPDGFGRTPILPRVRSVTETSMNVHHAGHTAHNQTYAGNGRKT